MADSAMLAAPHPRHDRLSIAAAADRTGGPLPALTQALLTACTECARLHADLLALASALPSAATPRRTRDFTLSAADADRLRPRGLRRWLGLVGTSRDTITRPLAIGFTTLGLAGLLLATVPGSLSLGSAGAAPSADQERAAAAPSGAASAAPTAAALSMSAEPSPVDNGEVFNGSDSSDPAPQATQQVGDIAAETPVDATIQEDPTGLSTLAVIGGTLLILGLGAFALRWTARRLGDG